MNLDKLKVKIYSKLGIDKSIAYSSGARIVQGFTGVISVFFISKFLSETEQGFYYTFGSLLALQVFFELGLTNILTQYIAYESACLKWENHILLSGDNRNRSRLSHLLRLSVNWYSFIGIIFLGFLILGGFVYFSKFNSPDNSVNWFGPWCVVCISTVCNLFMTPLLAILNGLDKIKEVAKLRFYQQILIPSTIWIGLAFDMGLYVLGISQFLSFLITLIWMFYTPMFKILKNIWIYQVSEKINYMEEIFPYQWKIAISWISGYFVLQIFNPVLFANDGPVIAGQMGMTLVAYLAIAALSQNWINTKIPKMTKLIARNEYTDLDSIFNKTVKQISCIFLLLLIAFWGFIYIIRLLDLPIGDRFLSWLPLMILAVPLYISQFVNCWSTYLRCHKKEPLLLYSIITGVLCCLSTMTFGVKYGVIGMTFGYCLVICIMSIWAYKIYINKKEQWHKKKEI